MELNHKNYKSTDKFNISEKDFPTNPTTSWVIRTLNEEKWLGMVLNSLFLQSRLDFEIIIVDSGSTDKTLNIIDNFPVRKLIKIRKDEYNHSYALNLSITESWGKYIGIISGHSVPTSRKWYQDAIKNFKDKKVAAVTGHYHSLPDADLSEKVGDLFFNTNEFKTKSVDWMTNTNAIIRKDLWKEYPFDENLPDCEDYDWCQEMIARDYKIIADPAFIVYHSHGGLGKPIYRERVKGWKKTCAIIDKKIRPSNSHKMHSTKNR